MDDPGQWQACAHYGIVVKGILDSRWSAWLGEMEFAYETTADGVTFTTLTGPVVDQAALRGILAKIADLNLPLVLVIRLDMCCLGDSHSE
jgi:hypothetical protein